MESKVFYYKMKGDYYRYLAEVAAGDKKEGCYLAHVRSNLTGIESLTRAYFAKLGLAHAVLLHHNG